MFSVAVLSWRAAVEPISESLGWGKRQLSRVPCQLPRLPGEDGNDQFAGLGYTFLLVRQRRGASRIG